MMIAGSISPRTESRLDPALPSSPRICKWTQVKTSDNIDNLEEDLFEISKSRSSTENCLAKPKSVRRSSVSLPGISSALFNVLDSESAPSNNPDLLGLPVVAASASENDRVQFIDYETENMVHQTDGNIDVMKKHDTNMKISDLVSYANNQPLCKSTQRKYRAIRSAVQNRVKVVTLKEKSHSARRPRRENEESYLKCKFHERPCSRMGSFWIDNKTNDLCRECCDVLGPKSCRECFQITQRVTSKNDNEDMFPHIGAKPSEFSTMDLAHKMFPELSTLDILHHLKEGNISTEILQRHQIESYAQQRRKRSASEKSRKIRERVNLYKAHEDDNFFQNFNDLKLQMVLKRKQTSSTTVLEPVRPLSSRPPPPEIELIPIAENSRENPANYFDPPVMTQEEIKRQRSQPRFYAGEKSDYKLPETANMTSVLKESNRALKNLSSSQTFGIIEEAEEEEEEENDGEDVGPADLMSVQHAHDKEELLSSSSNFYKPMDLTQKQNDLLETTKDHRGRFENEDDLLDTDKFFSEEARKLDTSSEEDSGSSDEEPTFDG